MTYFALGIERMTIVDNRELLGSGEAKFWSFASDDRWDFINIERMMSASESERRALVRSALNSINSQWESHEYRYLSDEQDIIFGDTGVVVFERNYIPDRLHWTMFGIESDEDIRNIGSSIASFLTDDKLDQIAASVLTVAGIATSPVTAASITLSKIAMEAATSVLKNNKDDQLALIRQSFIRWKDYPAGTRHGIGVSSVLQNMWYDYFIYGYDPK